MLPEVIRIFFAIDLPIHLKDQLGEYMLALKKKAKTNAIRWTKPENLHITLQFLAQVQRDDIPKMITHVKEELLHAHMIHDLQLSDLELFPSPFRPRVIVLDVLPRQELAELAVLVGEGIIATDYEIDDRPFRGHLTLARIKHPNVNLEFLREIPTPNLGMLPLNEIVLFRSEPQPDGSIFTPIERIELYRGLNSHRKNGVKPLSVKK